MKLFANPESILGEISDMEKNELKHREDRAVVSKFYSGQPPLTNAEARRMGISVNVNNLLGYTDLANTKDQTLALYTKPPRLYNVTLDSCPIGKKAEWEQKTTAALNTAIKKANRLRPGYEGVAGDATMHGEGDFFFPDPRCPLPKHLPLSQRLIPAGSPADINDLSHFAVTTGLSVFEIMRHVRRKSEGWNTGNLQKLANAIFSSLDRTKTNERLLTASAHAMNPEEIEYARQESSTVDKAFRTKVPVTYFYQADPSKDGRPLDLTILLPEQSFANKGEKNASSEVVLFEADEYFPAVRDAIQPFFMDCILGGSTKWHRVKGLGHINYGLNWTLELLMNRLMQGTMEASTDLWQATDGANREDLEKILLRHNGIIPEHLNLVGNRRQFDFQGILAVINTYRQSAARNAQSAVSNGSGEPTGKELEVQAVFRQGQITAQQASRLANWYDAFGTLGGTILARYTSTDIVPSDAFYSEVNEFQAELRRQGIPLWYVQPHNVKVEAVKITGDGNEQKATAAAQFFMQNMAMYPAESQQLLKRIVTGIVAGDYELAERLIPIDDKPETDQLRAADGENNTAIIQGRAPEISAQDVDEDHVPIHLKGLASILQRAGARGEEAFTADEIGAFKALGGHAIAHVHRMESMGKKDDAAKFMDAVNQLAKVGEKFEHNRQQAAQAAQEQQKQPDPIDAMRLQLDSHKLELAAAKQDFKQRMDERKQAGREQSDALGHTVKLAQEARDDQGHRSELAARDVELALAVKQGNQPGQPAGK